MKNNGKEIAAQALAKTKTKKHELLFEEIRDALILHDFNGKIIKVNKNVSNLLGFSKEELSTKNILHIALANPLNKYKESLKKLAPGKQICFETKLLQKSVKEIPVEITSKIIEIDNSEVVLSTVRDISIRKNYENQLIETKKIAEANEMELNAIFNNSPASIFVFDEEMRILRVNKKAIYKFNINNLNLHNQRLGDIVNCVNTKNKTTKCGSSEACNSCKLTSIFRRTIAEGKTFTKEEIQISIHNKGAFIEKTMLVSTSLLKRNGHSIFLATIDDISKRKKMEQELVQAKIKAQESEKLKTAFIDNLSHEIRTPLNGILGFIDFFEDDNYNFSSEEKKKFIKIMHKSGERLINTVSDLVKISKINSGILELMNESFNLPEALDSIILKHRQNYENAEVDFICNIDSQLKEQLINTDKLKLLQTIRNLLDNAFKFTLKGQVKLDIQIQNSDLMVSINDSGIGIAPEYHIEIFKPFWQVEKNRERAFEGNGLGLTVAQKLVTCLGGELMVKSEVGKGSKFFFSLPNAIKAIPDSVLLNAGNFASKSNLKGKTILIVEDELSNYLYLEAVLLKENCKLLHAFNGKEALDMVMQNPAIDLVLMDLRMPVMDGFEATARINEIRKNIPIIAQSAFVLNGEKEKALEAGCIDFLSKPLKKEMLISVIAKHLKLHV